MLIKQVSYAMVAAVFCGSGILAGQDSRSLNQLEPMALKHETGAASALVDKGMIGSVQRGESRTFNGIAEKPAAALPPGLRGSPDLKAIKTPDGTGYSNVVTMNSAHAMHAVHIQQDASADTVLHAKGPTANITIDQVAQLVAPLNGTALPPEQTFAWTAGSSVSEYYLWIGSCFQCADILDESEQLNLSRTVSLPNDGRIIYTTLFSFIGGSWYYVDYQFYTLNGEVPAYLSSPSNGATLGSPQTFTWTPGTKVTDYYLWVGSCQDCADILNENEGSNTSRTITLPVDGRTIFVTLYSFINGNWYYYDYQFRAGTLGTHRVFVTNNLAYNLDVFVNTFYVGTVSAYSTQYADVTVASLQLSFELVRPTLNGNVLGDSVAGYFDEIYSPSGNYSFNVTNQIGTDSYFLPLITNNTGFALEIEVNGGLQAQNKCNCDAPAYSTNVASGYYLLYANSNVRMFFPADNYTGPYIFWGEDANGTYSPGGSLPQYVQSNSGILYLTANSIP